MKYIGFFLALNFTVFIGATVLNFALASNYESNVAEYAPILDGIDDLMRSHKFEAALQEIDTHFEPEKLGGFQIALGGRKVICLAQLKRNAEAKACLDRMIALFPFIRDVNENLFDGEAAPEQYVMYGNTIIEFAKSHDEQQSEPIELEVFLTSWTFRQFLKYIGFNIGSMYLFHRWLTRKNKSPSHD